MGKKLESFSSRGKTAPLQVPWDCIGTRHDESGQVFTEVRCQGRPMTADWKRKTVGSALTYDSFCSRGRGCSSLYDMSIRSCLFNSVYITPQVLDEVPESLGMALWSCIVTAQLDSIQLFIEFAKRYPSPMLRKYQSIPMPNLPLDSYYKGLLSPNNQWLTYLTLVNVTVPRTALIQVSMVTNLVALVVGPHVLAPDIGVDDSLIRTWSRSASMGAFRSLRVLFLRGQTHLTSRAFEYLTSFPALAIVATKSTSGFKTLDRQVALYFGWKCKKYKPSNDINGWHNTPRRVGRSGCDEFLDEMFELSTTVDDESPQSEDIQKLDILPVMHLAIGGYGNDASLDGLGLEAVHIWNRVSKITEPLSEIKDTDQLPHWSSIWSSSTPKAEYSGDWNCTDTDVTRKRAHSATEAHITKKAVKPTLRTSKANNIGDLLSECGS